MSDPIVIKPKAAPLSTAAEAVPAQPADAPQALSRPLPRRLLLTTGGLLALGALYWVFVVLPGSVGPSAAVLEATGNTTGNATEASEPGSSDKNSIATPVSSGPALQVSPFRDTQLERARQQAETELTRFVELQIELEEQLQINAWGQAKYDSVKDLATGGDRHFAAREFEQALTTYRAATEGLKELRALGEAEYQSGMNAGLAALKDFNQLLAEREFANALKVKADDAAALAGAARAQQLPEIQSLLRKARQLARRGDTQAATSTYREILAIDPLTATVEAALAQLATATTNANFQDALSTGFAALERKRYSAATTAFNAALAIRPGDAVAKGGLQQIAQETEVKGLRSLRASASQAVAEERWEDAVTAFDSALKRDKNLAFAQAGRRDAAERLRLQTGMQTIVSQAQKLSDNKRMKQARELLDTAAGLPSGGAKWDSQLADAQAVVASYSSPVPVRLTSDNQTQITVYKVGRIGAFTTHDLSLRPGVYTIVGSQDGCQDIRKEVVVKPQMAPIEIRCENRL